MPVIHLVPFAIFLYVGWRFVLPLPLAAEWKWLAALALLAVSQQHLVVRTFFGSLASPELPSGVIAFIGWLFGAFIVLAAFLLLKDAVAVGLFVLDKAGVGHGWSVSDIRWALGAGIAALALSGFGVWQGIRVPDVRTMDVHLADLPTELDGLKLVQISDLHASNLFQEAWVRAVVEKTNRLDADIILLTGDVADGTPKRRAADVAPLRDLKARQGVFAITGNHEYYSGHDAWMETFDQLGMRVLQNEHAVVGRNGRSVVVAGITDSAASRFKKPVPNLEETLTDAPAGAPIILMAHRPEGAGAAAAAGVALQLSGHTHGGHMPGVRTLAKRFNEGLVSGLYKIGGMQLYVSNGTGLWGGFPIRIGTPSEITQIVLRTDPSGKTVPFGEKAPSVP